MVYNGTKNNGIKNNGKNVNKELYNAAKRRLAKRSTYNNNNLLRKAFTNFVGKEHYPGHSNDPGEFNSFLRTLEARGKRIFGENSKPVNKNTKRGILSRLFGR